MGFEGKAGGGDRDCTCNFVIVSYKDLHPCVWAMNAYTPQRQAQLPVSLLAVGQYCIQLVISFCEEIIAFLIVSIKREAAPRKVCQGVSKQ